MADAAWTHDKKPTMERNEPGYLWWSLQVFKTANVMNWVSCHFKVIRPSFSLCGLGGSGGVAHPAVEGRGGPRSVGLGTDKRIWGHQD